MVTERPITPCATRPEAWDLDSGDLPDWLAALRICVTKCPLIDACRMERDSVYPQASRGPAGNPQSVIWGGVAYSETGRVLKPESLRRLAATRRNAQIRREAHARPIPAENVGASSSP